MTTPQIGILPEASTNALFVTLDIGRNEDSLAKARYALSRIAELTAKMAGTSPEAGLLSVVSVGPGIWDELMQCPRPARLAEMSVRTNGSRKSPSTPADLLLHIRSERRDLNYELFELLLAEAAGSLHVIDETSCFRYFDARDLTGFVDGTENPEGEERAEVALVGDEDDAAVGGSYVIFQRYVHDLARWRMLEQTQQEQIIGRTKDTDQELGDDIKPASAHISRVVIEEDGEELEILRHSLPYGESREAGLVFAAYSRNREIFDLMLDRMFDVAGEGIHDHLMDYTRAVNGAYFFAPSVDMLKALA